MEEDIKWLKEWIERDRDIRKNSIESDFDKFCERNCEAIEHILNRLEQDEKVIKEMVEYISNYQDCPLDNCGVDLDCENRCRADDEIYKECWEMYFRKKCE